ncbi:hypothetical protein PILCRDRAFT_12306 [Piloderma croceum F 1598]|uniref:Luciferase-like domain-containing protein n=1 Tax=Piloderma croceum (strain F 1598) TaxID=765440 RepID=A0A0C3BIG9_PILCF|nr:hypothetical protein PILCRDRAFT_12306 [Piloderma croceum F 1598]
MQTYRDTFENEDSTPAGAAVPQSKKRWILNAFNMSCAGHMAPGLWKHADDRSARYHDIDNWTEVSKLLERGKFNGMFIADVLGPYDVFGKNFNGALRTGAQFGIDDPLLVISACAAVTKNLAFGVTASVSYEAPYSLARRFSTLDHLTKGRIAFNVVTGFLTSAAKNFGFEQQTEHDERYQRAEEYVTVLYKLWESSWRTDAVVLDRERDLYADPTRVRKINHCGKYYKTEGPNLVEPSPQGSPLIYQAGTSTAGVEFAGKHAEAVFVTGPTPKKVRAHVDNLRAAASKAGRDPQSIKLLVKLLVIVAATDGEAQKKESELRSYASNEGAAVLFGGWLGEDLSVYDEDKDLREVDIPAIKNMVKGYAALYSDEKRPWNRKTFTDHFKLEGLGPTVVGSPTTVADAMQRWVDEADVDGFNLSYALYPGTFVDIVELLVPELQRRGVHWKDYPTRSDGQGIYAREGIYGLGQEKFRDDHPGARYKWEAGCEPPPLD